MFHIRMFSISYPYCFYRKRLTIRLCFSMDVCNGCTHLLTY